MINFLADAASTTTETITEPKNVGEWFSQLGEAIAQMFSKGTIVNNAASNSFFGRLIMALVICIPCIIIIRVLFNIIKSFKRKKDKDYTASNFILSSIKGYLYIFLVITILLILGLPGESVGSIISSAIVAIGLSLQSIIKSFAAGFIIISSTKYKKGDKIVLNRGTAEGKVIDIGVLNTTLLTDDNNILTVSNSDFLGGTLLNKSMTNYNRIEIVVSTIYGYDIEEIKKILISCIKKQPGVTLDIKYSASLKDLGTDGLIFSVKCYAPASSAGSVKGELRERIYTEFLKRDIRMPYNVDHTPTDEDKSNINKISLNDLTKEDYALDGNFVSLDDMELKAHDEKDPYIQREKARQARLKNKQKKTK